MKAIAIIGILITAVGCTDTRSIDSTVTTTTDTVNGVERVVSSGSAPVWSAERIVRIGSSDSGATAFGRIRSVVADASGNTYVADNLANEIRVFTPQGQHLRSIGRRGSGPGEFADLYSLAWLGENLAAMDPRNARIALLTPDGTWTGSLRHYPLSGPPSFIRLHPVGTAGFYTPVIVPQSSLPFVRMTADGAADTIFTPRPPTSVRTGVLCHRPDGGVTGFIVPEAPTVVYAFPPPGGAVAAAWTESYRIAWVSAGGDTVRTLTRNQLPVAFPDSAWENAMQPFRQMLENYPGTHCEPGEPARPASRAALRHIVFDESGEMWVEAAADAGFTWDIFDARGHLIGQTAAPARAADIPVFVRDRRLYQVEQDSLGVQYVSVYQVGASATRR